MKVLADECTCVCILTKSTLNAQVLFLKYYSPAKGTGFLGEWLIPGLGLGKNKIILEHIVPEEKKCSGKEETCQKDKRVCLRAISRTF